MNTNKYIKFNKKFIFLHCASKFSGFISAEATD